MICRSNRGFLRLRVTQRYRLRSIIGEKDHTSSRSMNRPTVPAIAPTARFTASVQCSPCHIAGNASAAPPTIAAPGPSSSPIRTVASYVRSAARKFGTRTRTHTPSVSGMQIIATTASVCRQLRRGISSRFLNVVERASDADTAAATPSSTSSVIRIRLSFTCPTTACPIPVPIPNTLPPPTNDSDRGSVASGVTICSSFWRSQNLRIGPCRCRCPCLFLLVILSAAKNPRIGPCRCLSLVVVCFPLSS